MMLSYRILMLAALLVSSGGGLLILHPLTRHVPYAMRVLPWVEPGWTVETRSQSFTQFLSRVRQAVSSARVELATALCAGIAISMMTGNVAGGIALAGLAFASVGFARQQHAIRLQRKTATTIAAELPVIADYLALCSSAGLSTEASARRVPDNFNGLISLALAEAHEERTSVLEGLIPLAGSSNELRQLLDALTLSQMRGTPVSSVLVQQSEQMRNREQQQLLARSGRQEVLMLIPVIFIVFPTVVAVALFPGWQELKHLAW